MSIYDNLFPDQRVAVKEAIKLKTAGIFADMRTGKTWIAGALIERGMHDNYMGLVVTLSTNKYSTWGKFFNEQLPHVKIHTTDTTKVTTAAFTKLPGPKILIIHYDELAKGRLINHLPNIKWDMIFIDESHRIKNRNSGFSRNCGKLGQASKYRYILTGTPFDKDEIELWAQFRFLRPSIFGSEWGDFADEYCRKGGWMDKKWEFRKIKRPQFQKKVAKYLISITSKDAGILTAKRIHVHVTMKGEQRRIYDEMETDFMTTVNDDGDEVIADLTVTQRMKLQQITGGFIREGIDDGHVDHIFRRNVKLRKLKELVKRHPLPIVIFCKFIAEIDMIEKAMKKQFPNATVRRLQGKVKDTKKDKKRTRLLLNFQKGLIDILISQFKVGGSGVDMYLANTAYIYSYTESGIDNRQVYARLNDRAKTKRSLMYILMAKDSIDIDISDSLQSKLSTNKLFLKRVKEKRRTSCPRIKVRRRRRIRVKLRRKRLR